MIVSRVCLLSCKPVKAPDQILDRFYMVHNHQYGIMGAKMKLMSLCENVPMAEGDREVIECNII